MRRLLRAIRARRLLGAAVLALVVPAVAVAGALLIVGDRVVDVLPGLDTTLGRPARHPARDLPVVETTGRLELTGDDRLVIAGEHRVHRGNIVLRDRARLEIRGAAFDHVHSHAFEYTLEAHDDAAVVVTDAEIRSSEWLNRNFYDRSRFTLERVEERESRIWHYCADDCTVTVRDARFYGTLDHRATGDVIDAHDLFLFVELVWPHGVSVDEHFPRDIDSYDFPNEGEAGIPLRLHVEQATASSWGLTMRAGSNVAIRDTDGITITIAVGEPWVGVTAQLDGLRQQRYDDRTWQIADSTLRLQNTFANRWSPIVGTGNTLIVRDSELADHAFSWGEGRAIIERSSLEQVRARDAVHITLVDSTVEGDVVAQDDGVIVLERTRVGGRTVQEGRGLVERRE